LENPWGLKGKTTYLNCEYVWRRRADKLLSFACFLALMSSSANAQAQQNGNGRRRSAQSTIGTTCYIRHGQQNLTFHNLTSALSMISANCCIHYGQQNIIFYNFTFCLLTVHFFSPQ
jgi:hypothetical protein